MFLHHAADCATIVKRLLLSRLQSRNLSMYMILDINENNRKPSNDGLRLFHLFRTGSAPGGSFRFPIRWSPSERGPFFALVCRQQSNVKVICAGKILLLVRVFGAVPRYGAVIPC